MSELRVHDGITLEPMQDVPSLLIASMRNAEEPVSLGKVTR
jgi:hypothetical protein